MAILVVFLFVFNSFFPFVVACLLIVNQDPCPLPACRPVQRHCEFGY